MGRVVFVVTCVRIMAGSIRLSTSLNGVCRCSSLSNPFCGKPLRLSPFRPGLSPVRIGLVGEPGCFLLPCTFGSFGFLLPCTFGFTFRKSYASMLFASLALPLHPAFSVSQRARPWPTNRALPPGQTPSGACRFTRNSLGWLRHSQVSCSIDESQRT